MTIFANLIATLILALLIWRSLRTHTPPLPSRPRGVRCRRAAAGADAME